MQLNIKANKTINDVQHEFSSGYPYLKLEFFKPAGRFTKATAKDMLKHSHKIAEARKMQHEGIIEINDSMKVSELENILFELYGLRAQIFRKSGNVWLETTKSDNWTLKQQNVHGQEISNLSDKTVQEGERDYRNDQ